MPAELARVLRVLLSGGLALATVAGACAAGVYASMRASFAGVSHAVPEGGWPPPRAVPEGRIPVAVVTGAGGSVVTDVLAPYEVFARSDRFFAYTVSVRRRPVPLSGGLGVLPEYAFDDPAAPAPGVVVVPAVVDPAGEREAPLRRWIARQAARGALVLGVCAGSEVVAAAGLLDGRRATSIWARLGSLGRDYPRVRWQRGQRYVEDGSVITTAGVTSGVIGALRVVERLAGPAQAARVGRELAHPGWSPGGGTAIPALGLAPADLAYGLNAAFPWFAPTVGVGLGEGVGETDVAAAFEVYSGTSFSARAVPVAVAPAVRTRHGMTLLAVAAGAAVPDVDRLVVPGVRDAAGVDPPLARWAASRGLPVEVPHAGRKRGESGFDPVLRDLAARADVATARATAKFTEYPADHLRLTGAAWPWRSTALFALTVVAAAGLGAAPFVAHRVRTRRNKRTSR